MTARPTLAAGMLLNLFGCCIIPLSPLGALAIILGAFGLMALSLFLPDPL